MATINQNLSSYDEQAIPTGDHLKVGIVVSAWNEEITNGLYQGAFETLKKHGLSEENILTYRVPGSYELVFGAKRMFENYQDLQAIICLGSVIRGETAHFDYVCQAVSKGIMDLNIVLPIPVIFGVLTDDNIEQSRARSGGKHGNKGVEAAVTALQMTTF
jgi:6,7-dimethyl-8-ribityllumazine synthase